MKIFFLAALLLISACTHKQNVVYSSHWTDSWQNEILEKCNSESHLLTLRIYEGKLAAGYDVTQEDVDQLEKMIYQSCLKFHGLFI